MSLVALFVSAIFLSNILGDDPASDAKALHIKIPNVQITEEINLCTSLMIKEDIFINEFTPEPDGAHHMLLFGCETISSHESTRQCAATDPSHNHDSANHKHRTKRGSHRSHSANEIRKNKISRSPRERKHIRQSPNDRLAAYELRKLKMIMESNGGTATFSMSDYCEGEIRILYSWSHGGEGMKLPEGVSFAIKAPYYLVMNVHYMKELDKADTSGIKISYTNKETAKSAGIILVGSSIGSSIGTGESQLEANCLYTERLTLNPIAFRVHTHGHGTEVSGYRIRNGRSTLIGARDPQLSQSFVKVDNAMTIDPGDNLKMICKMVNTDDDDLAIGMSASDEMCNFYLLYWVEKPNYISFFQCSN